jgi:uncharacterized protein (DUF427 family)
MTDQIQRQIPHSNQESVWDYPRPPRVEPISKRIRVIVNGETIAETERAMRVLETSHPPVYYIPPEDVRLEYLISSGRKTFCEFKGSASYWGLRVKDRWAENAAWSYENAAEGYEAIKGYLAFYAGKADACYVGDEQVQPQEGDFYGGWITSNIVGPFKGSANTSGW